MLKGYNKISHKLDTRLPITLPILIRIMNASNFVCISQYQSSLFKAMCSLAFFAFLRVGEMTITKCKGNENSVLLMSQISKQYNEKGLVQSMLIHFRNFKHNYNQKEFVLVISRQPKACPVQSYLDYIKMSGTQDGPLFMKEDGTSVCRKEFINVLNLALKLCDLDPNKYKGHSFRIGAATYAAEQGISDAKIRQRWKSDAFKKYICISTLTSIE